MKLNYSIFLFALFTLLFTSKAGYAAVLPEERVDLMIHSFDGGGVEVSGPALLIRTNVASNTSVFYNYYVDNISSASIDVELGGSAYDEERVEQSVGVDFLNGKTTMNLSYTDSVENDYKANTLSLGISQDFFGDLSTLSMGYSQGIDSVGSRTGNNPMTFSSELSNIKRQNYRIGFSQILTKNSTISLGWETITDEATEQGGSGVTLNNPYRSYSFGTAGVNRSFAQEIYPSTRTSNALSIRGSYFIDTFKSAIHYEYSRFQDSWGIKSNTFAVSYVYPGKNWILDFRYRYYDQGQADFYRDMFDFANQFTFMARDKELSAFTSTSVGVSASYEFAKNGWGWIDKGSLNLSYDVLNIEYDNFRDARESQSDGSLAGVESLYTLEADIIQAYISIWY
ncbi:MAG TPA: DUF3570 domain-containing protein [Gammaproteobacteria bacterium]|nr:DUF3570 domain-containing protein [Gammaproteobacteria bacterium]